MNTHKELLIHAVKAIQYRFVKVTNDSKEHFGTFKISNHTRSPCEIINHLFDLTAKTKYMITEGHFKCPAPLSLNFADEKHRFLSGLKDLQTVMTNGEIDIEMCRRLLQGPLLDMATHVGQLAMLNGLHGNKIPKENYYEATLL